MIENKPPLHFLRSSSYIGSFLTISSQSYSHSSLPNPNSTALSIEIFTGSLCFLHLNYKERVNLNEESQRTKRKEEKAKWNEKKVSVTHASFPFTLPFSPSFPLSFRSFTLSLHFIVMSGEERERNNNNTYAWFFVLLCSHLIHALRL